MSARHGIVCVGCCWGSNSSFRRRLHESHCSADGQAVQPHHISCAFGERGLAVLQGRRAQERRSWPRSRPRRSSGCWSDVEHPSVCRKVVTHAQSSVCAAQGVPQHRDLFAPGRIPRWGASLRSEQIPPAFKACGPCRRARRCWTDSNDQERFVPDSMFLSRLSA